MEINIPRPEYPRPQMVREKWLNLNGEWQFEIDHGKSGRERKLYESAGLSGRILVPFCPESKLSGVEYKDFMPAVWYRREFAIPESWSGNRVLLHFGAVDYHTEVWINGALCGSHDGGYTPFCFDITDKLAQGTNCVAVYAEDDVRSGQQPVGKQCTEYFSRGCSYTRTTGIWQTVWLECVSPVHVSDFRVVPDADNGSAYLTASVKGDADGCTLRAKALYRGAVAGTGSARVAGSGANLKLELSEIHLWGPGSPELYDLELELVKAGEAIDRVTGYFGLRKISLRRNAICINDKIVFQRLVLDQGFYPDGIYTAPTDGDLKRDIELSLAAGFNGARMHEKVFAPRYLYWADRLGYLVWGEYANWGLDITTPAGLQTFLPEWMEAVERDFNHPSIVGWCPFNETWDSPQGRRQDDEVLRIVYLVSKQLDRTRPVIDTSGNFHVATDIFDIHEYEQDVGVFQSKFEPMKNGGEAYVTYPDRQTYEGQPYFVSEYGGIQWNLDMDGGDGWGYGNRPQSEEEFIRRYEGLTQALLGNPRICAFCYTQLYDVEQERNGLYTYGRQPKFDMKIFRKINAEPAAIEKEMF